MDTKLVAYFTASLNNYCSDSNFTGKSYHTQFHLVSYIFSFPVITAYKAARRGSKRT